MKLGKDYKIIASKILDCTLASYYNWDNQNRPIIRLLEKYFSKNDLEEFLEKEKIQKFDLFNKYIEERNKKIDLFIDFILRDDFNDISYEQKEKFLNIIINYNLNESFFKNSLKTIKNIDELFEIMIENNIILILEEIIEILIETEFKILVERAWYHYDSNKRDSAINLYIEFNIEKYIKNKHPQDKDNMLHTLIEKYNEKYYPQNKFLFDEPTFIFKEVERLKNI